MWPTTASSGEPSPILAIEEPSPSAERAANEASSRQTAAAGPSWPEGATVAQQLVE